MSFYKVLEDRNVQRPATVKIGLACEDSKGSKRILTGKFMWLFYYKTGVWASRFAFGPGHPADLHPK